MRTNYVLIDYENVQPQALSALDQEHFKVIVFVGASQTKIGFDAAAALHRMGSKAGYVKITGNGSNALDFHIAFYIGQLAAQDPAAYFHVISNDAGFDPLIQHLKARNIFAARSREIAEIPLLRAASLTSPAERLEVVVNKLRQLGPAKPWKTKTLSSTINALFGKQLVQEEVDDLLQQLAAQGIVAITGLNVSYALSG